jgi:hypothetical protein
VIAEAGQELQLAILRSICVSTEVGGARAAHKDGAYRGSLGLRPLGALVVRCEAGGAISVVNALAAIDAQPKPAGWASRPRQARIGVRVFGRLPLLAAAVVVLLGDAVDRDDDGVELDVDEVMGGDDDGRDRGSAGVRGYRDD